FNAVVKVTFDPPRKALIAAIVPVSVMVLEVPPIVTPVSPGLFGAARLPDGTDKVATTLLLPASTSANERPVSGEATSSVTVIESGTVFTGASLTALTKIGTSFVPVRLPPAPVLPLSLAVMVSVSLPLKFKVGV